ncbi:MAG: substrate-binding domain-containing protein [Oscillospiraceae bacterium]|nr:substrate-binding domain-containing protein [Oscillospiraceae bacterium]
MNKHKYGVLLVMAIIFITVFGLNGCGKTNSSPYIRLDGATANIPLAVGFYYEYYGIEPEEAEKLVNFAKSSQSYINLIEGKADLLLVSKADTETQKKIDQSGIELEYIPLRRDALCFIVNKENPVENLTDAEIKLIYQNKVTNWQVLGGLDMEIKAFQRNEDSGSQAMMRRLIMDGIEMAEAPMDYRIESMHKLVETISIASYDNSKGAIGYTTYYYIEEMYRLAETYRYRNVKLVDINGVTPSGNSILFDTYPYINESYIVIRADAEEDGDVRKAVDWLKSEKGKRMMDRKFYLPVE